MYLSHCLLTLVLKLLTLGLYDLTQDKGVINVYKWSPNTQTVMCPRLRVTEIIPAWGGPERNYFQGEGAGGGDVAVERVCMYNGAHV